MCTKLALGDVVHCLAWLTALRSLELDLSFCTHLLDLDGLVGLGSVQVSVVGQAPVAGLAGLQVLTLNLSCCYQLANVDGLKGLAGLTGLQALSLDLSNCSQLATLEGVQSLPWVARLRKELKDLKVTGARVDSLAKASLGWSLKLTLSGCSKLANVEWLQDFAHYPAFEIILP